MVELAPPRRGEVNYLQAVYMWQVYILKSKKCGKFYIGCTNNLQRRLQEHNSGYNKSTYLHLPWEIVCTEAYSNSTVAFEREKKIKSYKGGNAFKKLLKSE